MKKVEITVKFCLEQGSVILTANEKDNAFLAGRNVAIQELLRSANMDSAVRLGRLGTRGKLVLDQLELAQLMAVAAQEVV